MNRQQTVYLTPKGKEDLQAELDHLVKVKRPALAERLRKAIEQGDLSENANYKAAKEEQSFLEGRIQEIEMMLRNAEIIEDDGEGEEVSLGSRVTVVEDGRGEPEMFHIVGSVEADPVNGKVSHKSPMGEALIGHRVGDRVTVEAPGREIAFEIVGIQ